MTPHNPQTPDDLPTYSEPEVSELRCGVCDGTSLQIQTGRGKVWLHCWECEENGPELDLQSTGAEPRPPGAPRVRWREFSFISPVSAGYVLASFFDEIEFRGLFPLDAGLDRTDECGTDEQPPVPADDTERAQHREARDDLSGELRAFFRLAGWTGEGELRAFFVPAFFCRDDQSLSGTCCQVAYHVKELSSDMSYLAIPPAATHAINSKTEIHQDGFAVVKRAKFLNTVSKQLGETYGLETAGELGKTYGLETAGEEMAAELLIQVTTTLALLDHYRGEHVCTVAPGGEELMRVWIRLTLPVLAREMQGGDRDKKTTAAYWRRLLLRVSGMLQGQFRAASERVINVRS